MGAGAGQRGGMPQLTPQRMPQAMPQMGQMPPGVPTQGGISSLAAQGSQMDPRLAAIMQAMQQRGGMPGMPMPPVQGIAAPGGVPVQRPFPVGAGSKGAGMPRPGVPSTMINPPRPGMMNPRAQAAQSANPILAQMMRGGSR
jgi:hypothetical protein